MNRFAIPAIVVSLVVFGLALVTYLLGVNLLPSQAEAVEKGTVAPLRIVWAMIWLMEICAIALGVSLLRRGIQGLTRNSY
jgi:hypothetical protein